MYPYSEKVGSASAARYTLKNDPEKFHFQNSSKKGALNSGLYSHCII